MKLNVKNTFRDYFLFYQSIVGNKVIIYISLNILVGLLDGIGLTMFIPLLSIVFKTTLFEANSLGYLGYFVRLLETTGIALTIGNILLIILVLFTLKGFISFLQIRYLSKIRYQFITTVRIQLLNQLSNISYSGFTQLNAGKIQNSLTTEVSSLYNTMSSYFVSVQHLGMLITYYILAFMANYKFAILVLFSGFISNILYQRLFKKTNKLSIHVSKKGDSFNSYLLQSVHYFKYLKATNYFKKYLTRLMDVIKQTERLNLQMGKYHALSEGLKEPIAILVISILIYIQIIFFQGNNINSILISLLLFYRSLTQLSLLQTSWQFFSQSTGSIQSITQIAKQMQDLKESANLSEPPITEISSIRLQNVTISYQNRLILDKLNITINKNSTIALVGPSGSGKTSLAHVIIGLQPPTRGDIIINNNPLTHLNLQSYRNKIGYISQDPVVFNDSIFNNITFFDTPTEQNLQRFWNVVKEASLADFVNGLPDKEHSYLGDNGLLISGGQKQRISIARELYKKSDLLIFDEATSALDSATEQTIQANIEKLHGSHTIIIIAHRLSTIKNADLIYVFGQRQILATGKFDELLTNSPEFREMVSRQQF